MSILGLDISTACVGICILDNLGELLHIDHIDLSKSKVDLYTKANIVKKHLEKVAIEYKVDRIAIEECLLRFRMGKSSAHTLIQLARFNGIISYVVSQVFNVTPHHILAPHARKVVGIFIDKKQKKIVGIKSIIIDFVKKELKDKFVITLTKTQKYKPWMADRADAWVMARACFLKKL